jgi:hypothetical protein
VGKTKQIKQCSCAEEEKRKYKQSRALVGGDQKAPPRRLALASFMIHKKTNYFSSLIHKPNKRFLI